MTEGLAIQGSLAETTVPDLIRQMIRGLETGILTIGKPDRQDRIYFIDGQIVFASTNDPDYGVAETLLRTGDLNLDNYKMVLQKVGSSRRIGAVLCELGYLQADELLGAFERQVGMILMQTIGFRGGRYTIEFTTDFGPEVMSLPLKTERLILDGIEEIEHWSLIQRGVGSTERMLRHVASSDARLYYIELTEDESHIFSLLASPHSVRSVVEQSYLANYVTCRILWALQSVNLIEESAQMSVDEQRAEAAGVFELESNVEKYNAVFQAIFRIVFQRIGDYTWDFVDRVVQHISPEVRPFLSGITLVNEGRIDFDQLMNNLISAGIKDERTTIYTVLNELLYGWVYEIKREFGSQLDLQVNQILRPLRG
jgi:hypothetical protein